MKIDWYPNFLLLTNLVHVQSFFEYKIIRWFFMVGKGRLWTCYCNFVLNFLIPEKKCRGNRPGGVFKNELKGSNFDISELFGDPFQINRSPVQLIDHSAKKHVCAVENSKNDCAKIKFWTHLLVPMYFFSVINSK